MTPPRSTLSVILGIVALTISWLAIELIVDAVGLRFFSDTFPTKEAIASSVPMKIFVLIYGSACAALGGYVAALVAVRSKVKHAVAVAVAQEILTATAMVEFSEVAPLWFWILTLVLLPCSIVLGGCWRARQETA